MTEVRKSRKKRIDLSMIDICEDVDLLWSSKKGRTVDALVHGAEEGRRQQRDASGSREQAMIRRYPNGATLHGSYHVTPA